MILDYFKTKNFHSALRIFFKNLNIPVNYITEEPAKPRTILTVTYKKDHPAFMLMDDVYFLGMVDDAAFEGSKSLAPEKITSDYDGILIFGVTLTPRDNGLLPTRSQLAEITRAFNREFHYTPVVVVFKYENLIAFANAERLKYKQEWREGEKAGKVSLLRDVDLENPHSGHLRILSELAISRSGKNAINDFANLYVYWQTVFNVSLLNKKFYEELSNWYFWAIKEVTFPSEPTIASLFEETRSTDQGKLKELRQEHNAKNVIRLLTRFLFVWFIKEKKLIPAQLFDHKYLTKELLKDLSPYHDEGLFKSANIKSHYYKAILQNLFFATLNQDMGKRAFRRNGQNMNVTTLLRYEACFKDPQKFIDLVESKVPFMNGGLFECLDKPHPTEKGPKGGDVIIRKDGFSDRTDNPLKVPDYLFFGLEEEVDLSAVIGIKNKKTNQAAVKGLINIFESYKFTITENTPIEEDIALDPELLGKVFENLLASYNPETQTTARKQTGSFYTPREIVNYMVDESLIAYLKNTVKKWDMPEEELDAKLHELFSYDAINPFSGKQALRAELIEALDNCTILDPACGSGAFPMGFLQKMVHVLQKLDPDNKHWYDLQMEKVLKETETVFSLTDKEARKQKLEEINEAFDQQVNDPDYARKLFLIENCIYGVDIQPIAAQISKLRFFISLVVDQKVDKTKSNFGIRPLPNLETKFVAANTLIGIEKPDKQGRLFENPEIKKLEQELKNVRHRIFSAKTPTTKRKLRDEDKDLRENMGELLVKRGWGNESARLLATWDPYDQNASSPFFDPEWMFGVQDGFDVVIGNPPYGVSIQGEYRKKVMNFLRKVPDYEIYYFFIEVSRKLLSESGILSYIIPNTYLFNVFAENYRKDLLKEWKVNSLIDFTDYELFEGATVRNSVIILENTRNTDRIKFLPTQTKKQCVADFLNQKAIQLDVSLLYEFSQNWALALKLPESTITALAILKKNSRPLSYFFPEISQGLIAYDKYRGQDKKIIESRAYHYESFRPGLKKWLWGGDISKYRVCWNGKEYIDYCDGIANPRDPKFFIGKRMLVREITNPSIFAAITDEEFYNDPAVIIVKESEYPIESAALILNSKIGSFYHFNASPKATKGEFPKILVKDIKEFPISNNIINVNSYIFINLYKLASYVIETSFYHSILKRIIDGICFELYFPDHMSEKQIDILQLVKKDIMEVINSQEFSQLSDVEKENIINQLHAKWTHPDSEVRNRIKLFAVRSPDILKPILESK
jgi:adenine-specific DNA-methyltransferase